MFNKEEDLECVAHNRTTIEVCDTPVLSRARMSLPSTLRLKQVKAPNQGDCSILCKDSGHTRNLQGLKSFYQ